MTSEAAPETRERRRRLLMGLLPIVVFAGLAVLFVIGLTREDPSRVPSVLIGKPAPTFDLPPLDGMTRNGLPVPGLKSSDLAQGQTTLVNVWASWCGPCRAEHPQLMALAGLDGVRVVGINYKDEPENARRFLGALGSPFAAIGVDRSGRIAVDWGVYGVPETFIVDGRGIIRHKFIGPITESAYDDFLTRVREVQAATPGSPSP